MILSQHRISAAIISELKKTVKLGERSRRRSVLDKRRDTRFYYEFANDWGISVLEAINPAAL